MGFGHRVYKNYDPRAKLMRETCHEVLDELGLQRRPAVQARDGAREDRARGRLFRVAQALSERRLLLGHRAEGDRHPGAAVHRDLRARAHGRLDRAAERDDRRSRVQDRPPAAALHGRDAARRSSRSASGDATARRTAAGAERGARAPACRHEDRHDEHACSEFEPTSTLFGGNAPFIEEQYEHYLADPGVGRAPTGAPISTRCAAARPTSRTRR